MPGHHRTKNCLLSSGFALLALFFTSNADGAGGKDAIPEGFAILAERSGLEIAPLAKRIDESPGFKLTDADKARGFLATVAATSERISAERPWREIAMESRISLFGTRGEYRNFTVAVKAIDDVKGLNFKTFSLAAPSGASISKENIELRRAVMLNDRKSTGHFLEKDFPVDIPSGNTAWLWGTIFVPEGTKAGNYKATLEISSSSGKSSVIELDFLVLDFKLEAAQGSWGAYMPGHFNDHKSGGKVFASPGLKAENLDLYFKFWRTLRLNSPTLCHIYPELKLVNGRVQAEFAELRAFAEAIKKAGLDGYMVLDTRHIEWWSGAAALKYEKLKSEGKDVSGDMGVYSGVGPTPGKYPPLALELYADAIRQLLSVAAKEGWPRMLLFPEEEVGNGGSVKPLGYETFMPVLKKIAPDKVILIDNDIGYGRRAAIDRGARDGLKFRQYNSWEEGALQKAVSDGAEVWGYNYGFSRAAFGFLQQRLGSTGYHNWAEQWPEWVYSIITKDGMISSVEFEQSREGRFDYDYANTLKVYAGRLKKSGNAKEAGAMLEKLKSILSEIPVQGPEFRSSWQRNASSRKLDDMRWMIVQEIIKARRLLGERVVSFPDRSLGNPALLGIAPIRSSLELIKERTILRIPYLKVPISLDGALLDECWREEGNSTGALKWMLSKEASMRAYAASEEEFRKMPAPNLSTAAFAYDKEGLYIGFTLNHISPENDEFSMRADGDADLWRDNCMEFFFMPSDPKCKGATYHLIVNTHGHKVMLLGSKSLDSGKIKTAVKGNANASGGSSQEVFFPWSAFGLEAAPAPGTVWLANVARENYCDNQLTSWARVNSSFWEQLKWGGLSFEGPAGNAAIRADDLGLFPGRNSMKGRIVFKDAAPAGGLTLVLKDSAGRVVNSMPLPLKAGLKEQAFAFAYEIPRLKTQAEWSLAAIDAAGNEAASLRLPIPAFGRTIAAYGLPSFISSGERFSVDALLCIGNEERSGRLLEGEFVDASGKSGSVKLKGIGMRANGDCRIWVDSSGIPCGKRLFRLWLSKDGVADAAFEKEMEVLPPFAP